MQYKCPFLLKSEILSFLTASVTAQQTGLCQTWLETQIVGFLFPRVKSLTLCFRSIGLFCHYEEPGEIRLVHGCNVSMNTMDFPDAREFFENISSHILSTEEGGQLDVFAPLAASGMPC